MSTAKKPREDVFERMARKVGPLPTSFLAGAPSQPSRAAVRVAQGLVGGLSGQVSDALRVERVATAIDRLVELDRATSSGHRRANGG
jgi:hypothetical protein